MTELIMCAFGVYAVTLVVSSYAGPFHAFSKFRRALPAGLNEMVTCFVCLSWYVGAAFAFAVGLNFLEYLAVVGLAIFAEEVRN
jgi:hypothetical protein